MAVLTVDGTILPSPSEMKVTVFEVGSSRTRTASGALVTDSMGVKRKLGLRWAYLTPAQMGQLLKSTHGFFEAEYPDPEAGMRKMTCRSGDCTAGILRLRNGDPMWTNVSAEWVER